MAFDLIDNVVNRDAIEQDFDFLVSSAQDAAEKLKVIKSQIAGSSTVGGVNAAAQKAPDQFNNITQATEKLTKANNDNAKSVQSQNKALKDQATQLAATAQSYVTLKQKLDQVNAAIKSATPNSSLQKQLLSQRDDLVPQVNAASNAAGNTRVSNFTDALQILQERSASVNAEMQKLEETNQKGSIQYQNLAKEAGVLNPLLQQQAAGFTSVNREVLSLGRALQTLEQQGLAESEEFERLSKIYVTLTKESREFRQNMALQTSEAPGIQALTIATKGLAGSYAIGAASVSLFGDKSGELSEKLNQLVAIQTLLQGLEEVNTFIQRRAAIATVLFGEATVAATEAVGDEAVATTAATVSTTAFAAALEFLEANPIVLVLTALVGVLILLYENLDTTHDELIKNIEAETDWANAINETTDALREQINLTNESTDATKENLQAKLEVAEKEGQSQEKLFALRKAILDLEGKELVTANASAANQNVNQKDVVANLTDYENKKIALDEEVAKLSDAKKAGFKGVADDGTLLKDSDGGNVGGQIYGSDQVQDIDDRIKDAQADIEKYKAAITSLSKTHKDYIDLQKRNDDYDKNVKLEKAAEDRFYDEEKRKLILASAELEFNSIKDKNARILADEKSSFTQRIEAERETARAELKLKTTQDAEVQNDVGKTGAEKSISFSSLQSYGGNASAELQAKQAKELVDYNNKIRDLSKEINDALINQNAEAQEKIYKDTSNSLERRLGALSQYNNDQVQLLKEEFDTEVKNKGLDNAEVVAKDKLKQEELLKLQTDYAAKTLQLATKTKEELSSIAVTDIAGTFDLERAQNRLALANKEAADFAKSKNNKHFDAVKKVDEDKSRGIDLQSKVDQDNAILQNPNIDDKTKSDTIDKLLDDQAAVKNNDTKTEEDKRAEKVAKEQELANQVKEITANTIDTVQKLEDDAFEKDKQRLEAKAKLIEEAEKSNIANLEKSSLNATEKQTEIAKAERAADVQRKQIQAQQRKDDIEKARFDKLASEAKIILSTEVAVMKAYEAGPLGYAAAVFAAIQGAEALAVAAATPIPSYEFGGTHTGGIARWAEAGGEFAELPSGQTLYSATEQIQDMPAGTVFTPAEKYLLEKTKERTTFSSLTGNPNMWLATTLTDNLDQGFNRIERAVKQIPPSNVTIQGDSRMMDYFNKAVRE